MAGQLPRVGTVAYNGYIFPQTLRARMNATAVYDSANRTVKYWTNVFTIDWELVDTLNQPLDDVVAEIKSCLSEPGGQFIFNQQGLAGVDINGAEGVYDSAFGPTPLSFSWVPIGSNRAARLSWTVEVHTPECCQVVPTYTGQPMEFTYEVSFAVDHRGMTTRSITGTLEIPMTRRGHNIPDIADNYRERIEPPVPANFRRQSSFNVSRDKRTLSFSIVDSEINSDNPYPEGVTDLNVVYDISQQSVSVTSLFGIDWLQYIPFGNLLRVPLAQLNIRNPKWICNLRGSFTLLAGQPASRAWDVYRAIRDQKRDNPGFIFRDGELLAEAAGWWILLDQNYSESLYDRSVTFSSTWMRFTYDLDVLSALGMWKKVPAPFNDWTTWKTSMNEAFNVRGFAKLRSSTTDDVIVDLCQDGTPLMGSEGDNKLTASVERSGDGQTSMGTKESWMDFQNKLHYEQDQNKARHRFYQDVPRMSPGPSLQNKSTDTGHFTFPEGTSAHNEVIQDFGAPSYTITMFGYGVRAGHGVPIPQLRTVGGLTAVRYGTPTVVREIAGYLPVQSEGQKPIPIQVAAWSIPYAIDNSPGNHLGEPANYMAGYGNTNDPAFNLLGTG